MAPRRSARPATHSPSTAPPSSKSTPLPDLDPSTLPSPATSSRPVRMAYRIGRGEQGVLTVEPYKSALLAHWRFRDEAVARRSAAQLRAAFAAYVARRDFGGADMARKFLQMGMTRARRYANYAGGRKYARGEGGEGEGRVQLEKSAGHAGREEKVRASRVFEEVWRECKADEDYLVLKQEFMAEQKIWDREAKKGHTVKQEDSAVKEEENG